ncbi:uncharacterized protein LOC111687197 [Lucilia cuprina]|uniref:uncharacterized protein LOC111687197 n=1 Tax=Lucilia cuprina TaxID=7375 RepID=UPI001F059F68|nr:uncharacterized protein LOC111687197 [Lucilia cuprina]
MVKTIGASINVEIKEGDISKAYRIKKQSNKIIVEFSTLCKKTEFMSKIDRHRIDANIINNNGTDSNGNKFIYINDQLSFNNRRLLWLAKTKAKEANWKFVWVRSGIICARIKDPNLERHSNKGSDSICENELNNITSQFDLPYLLLGDFNSHNSLWGSSRTDSRGKIVEKFINNNNLNILNKPECATHFSLAHKSFSNIDLSLVSPNINIFFEWNVCDDLHNSDHYPIIIGLNSFSPNFERRPRWNIKRARWEDFKCSFTEDLSNADNTDIIEKHITSTILNSAREVIPQNNMNHNRREVPWWNENIKSLIKERRSKLKKFKQNCSSENLARFLRAKSEARRAIRENGSVMDEKAGFAIYSNYIIIKKRISNYSSIYTSELLALKTCIENIPNFNKKILIISDSKSALEGLQNPFSSNTIINSQR